jgi:hypothetical protein
MKRGIVIFILLVALTACGNMSQAPESASMAGGIPYPTPAPVSAPADSPSQERIILKDAAVSITVQDVPAKISEIGRMAEEMGGWIVSSNTSQSPVSTADRLIYGRITVRLPADRLDEAMSRIKDGTEAVNSENINGRDVTDQYIDLSSRLKNLQAAEEKLQEIMDSAENVTDVMAVYNQLVTTRGEIESIQGQLNYFDEAAAYSSVAVTLNPVLPGAIEAQTTGWNPLKTVEGAFGALIGVLQGAVDFLIVVVVVILPPALVIGVPIWLVVRRLRRKPSTQNPAI